MITRVTNQAEALAAARQDLGVYSSILWPPFTIAKHHALLIQALEEIERGEHDRLILALPPRHGKSTLTSMLFPAWYLGRHPDRSIIAASYSQEFALDFGRRVRQFMLDPKHALIFPKSIPLPDNLSAHRLAFAQGGHYYAAGIGGPIVGRGANIFLIDDPIKSRAEASSAAMRSSLRSWYESVCYTRLEANGAVILILTRWSQDDLAGWLLREHASDGWRVLSLPAIAEKNDLLKRKEGEPLWPQRFPLAELERRREAIGTREFLSQYQSRPVAEEGNVFRLEWFRRFNDRQRPKLSQTVIAMDCAFKTGAENDYTVLMVIGESQTGYYILHVTRERLEFPELKRRSLALAEAWSPNYCLIEDASSGTSLIQSLRSETILPVLPVKVSTDKVSRAHACSPMVEGGKVYIPESAHWVRDFLDEVSSFPAGAHDDQVDSLSLGLNYLRENKWTRPVLTLAPSSSWQAQPDPGAFHNSDPRMRDMIDDGELPGSPNIWFKQGTRGGRWSAF
jgi:predicted phage terminase large subunit-like protein